MLSGLSAAYVWLGCPLPSPKGLCGRSLIPNVATLNPVGLSGGTSKGEAIEGVVLGENKVVLMIPQSLQEKLSQKCKTLTGMAVCSSTLSN